MKKLKTNKLFYGEWPYKINTHINGGNLIKTRGIEYVKKFCTNEHRSPLYKRAIAKEKLFNYVCILETFDLTKIKIRAEYDTVNIFVKDKNLYSKICQALDIYVSSVVEPVNEEELSILLDNNKSVFCDRLPHGIYQYKAIFKSRIPLDVREKLARWLVQYDHSKLLVSNDSLHKLENQKTLWGECFVYVADKNMLILLQLASQGYIRRTEEFIVRSSINTSS